MSGKPKIQANPNPRLVPGLLVPGTKNSTTAHLSSIVSPTAHDQLVSGRTDDAGQVSGRCERSCFLFPGWRESVLKRFTPTVFSSVRSVLMKTR